MESVLLSIFCLMGGQIKLKEVTIEAHCLMETRMPKGDKRVLKCSKIEQDMMVQHPIYMTRVKVRQVLVSALSNLMDDGISSCCR